MLRLDDRLGSVGVIPRAMGTGHLDDEGPWLVPMGEYSGGKESGVWGW